MAWRKVLEYGGAAVAVLALAGLAVAVAGRLAQQDVLREARRLAADAAGRAEAVLTQTRSDLAMVQHDHLNDCREEVIAYLDRLSLELVYGRYVGVSFGGEARSCSRFGELPLERRPVRWVDGGLADGDGLVGVGDMGGGPGSVVVTTGPLWDTIAYAVIPPQVILGRHRATRADAGGWAVAIYLNSGALVARNPLTWEREPAVRVRVDADTAPVHAVVTAGSAVLTARFRDNMTIVGPVTLVAALVCAVLVRRLQRRMGSMENQLVRAVRRREIEPYYQPIIDLHGGQCCGVEALMRWNHPHQGLVRPDLFIPLAEETGQIVPLTRVLMERVAEDFVPLMQEHSRLRISINLASAHFARGDVTREIDAIFGATPVARDRFVFEITERKVIAQADAAAEEMKSLKAWSARLYLDDFGTGYSGLSYLQNLPVDGIKIDRLFVSTVGTDAPARRVIDAILHIGTRMNLAMVAEGVEEDAQAQRLREAGVEMAQGFLWSRPLPIDELRNFLAHQEALDQTQEVASPGGTAASRRTA